jgi:uncharacterized membrane protein YhhN
MLRIVTPAAWIFAAIAAVAAIANWVSRASNHRPTELWSKPLALIALIGVAVTLDPADPTVRAWFVAALACSLAGDVLLLDDRRFVFGLAAFLLGHLAYAAGFIAADEWRWWGFLLGVAAMVGLVATAGRRIVAAARRDDPVLGGAVVAYLLIISAMAVTAVAAGNVWAVGGALLFVASDTVLGWRKFVAERPWMPVAIMVTYHLGQAGLVASLL